MADSQDLTGYEMFGEPVKLGQECPECQAGHWCDGVCFRFSPKTFYCLGCGQYRKHRPMEKLLREHQMRVFMNPSS
jgi:hypothetical protein